MAVDIGEVCKVTKKNANMTHIGLNIEEMPDFIVNFVKRFAASFRGGLRQKMPRQDVRNMPALDYIPTLILTDDMIFFKKKSKVPTELFIHTDIHCHLVPGIDDGQQNAEEAAVLVEHSRRWGFEKIYCTPHITQDRFENTPEIIAGAFSRLKEAVEARGVDVMLDYSAEHRIDGFFFDELEKGHIRPFPNNYLLVENSFIQEAWNLDQTLFDLNVKGYKPILAHPERYVYYFDKKQRYEQLHSAGTLFQVNILSLAGYYGKDVRQMAEYLVEKDLVDFIATDMHNATHREAIEEYLSGKAYLRHAARLEGRVLNDTAFEV